MTNIKLIDVSAFSVLVPALTLSLTGFKVKRKYRHLAIFVIMSAVIEVAAFFFNENNLPLINIFLMVSILINALIFYALLESGKSRLFIATSSVIVLLTALIQLLFVSISRINSLTLMLVSVQAVIYSLLLLFQCIPKSSINLMQSPEFLIAAAFLFYYCGSFVVFAFSHKILIADSGITPDIWHIHSFTNISFNLVLARIVFLVRLIR